MFARLLDYRVTGNTESLMPDDFDVLGVEPPDPNALTHAQIDQMILASDDPEPSQEMADWVASLNMPQTPAHIAVQHLTAQVYADACLQTAYFKALPPASKAALLRRLRS